MASNVQSELPIIWLLTDTGIPLETLIMVSGLAVKPQQVVLNRNARGTVFNTASSAFLEDYGEGIPTLEISGTTGFRGEFGRGFQDFKILETMFISYLAYRQESLTPGNIQLLYIDTINVEAFSVYPMRFTMQRSARSPQLFNYNISLVVLDDLLENALFTLTSPNFTILNGTLNNTVIPALTNALQQIENNFSNILPTL